EVEGLRFRFAKGARAVLDRGDLVAGPAEALFEHPAEAVCVVGDENASLSHGSHCIVPGYLAMGRKQDTAVPCPGSLVTCIAPLCSSMMRWQSASPSPMPRSLVVKNGVKTLSRVAS